MRSFSESGQASVEAAVLLPVLLALAALLLQPAILLYNHCVMSAAAAEGCRMLATRTASDANARAYIERRLEAIPRMPIFHEGSEWDISWSDEAEGISVRITNHARPLPLFGITAALSGYIGADGNIEQSVQSSCSPIPAWIADQGYAASAWIGRWD